MSTPETPAPAPHRYEPAIEALEQATRPQKLVDQIERANEREAQLRVESGSS